MALKLKLSQFSDISASILTNSDKLPILQYNGSDYANKTITIETLKDELFRDGGVFIVGDSYITGNLFISGSLVSEQIISSSTVDIGDNIILLNTLSGSPKRYAGIEVIDSGSSPNISSSFLWDSQNNYWILTSLSSSNLILTTITSSNISASGTISGSTLHCTTSVTSPIGNFTNITASNISASNNITTNTLIISGSVSSPANTTISGTLKTYKPSYGFDTNGPSNTGITYTVPSFTDLYDLNVRQSLNVDGIINCDTGSYDYIRINDIDIHTISFGAYYDSSGGSIQSTTYDAVDLENNNIINVAQIELDKGSKTDVSIPNIYSNNSIDIISNGFTTRFSNTGISASGAISGSTLHGTTSVTSPIGNFTNITASNISASSAISGSTIRGTTSVTSPIGNFTNITASNSFAQGLFTVASGQYSYAHGASVNATGIGTHAEGVFSTANGDYSHAEGYGTFTSGNYSHAEGHYAVTSGSYSHAEGYYTIASGDYQHVSGKFNATSSNTNDLFIIGNGTSAGSRSNILVVNTSSVIVGGSISSSGIISGSTLHGTTSVTSPIGSFTQLSASQIKQGQITNVTGIFSHAEGYNTLASGNHSHAEGNSSTAAGEYTHAEGYNTYSTGSYTHAEGWETTSSGISSHAEGWSTRTIGQASHAEGYATLASGSYSHTEGYSTTASGDYQHVSGKFNVASSNENDLFIIGNGTSAGARSNILVVNTSSVIVGGSISASGQIYGYVADEFMVAVSDEVSNIASGSNKLQFIFPFALTGSSLTAYVHTAPVGSFITCSARIIGGSTISASISGSNKSGSASTTYYINKYQEVAIDIDQVGSTTAGKGLKLIFEGTRRI